MQINSIKSNNTVFRGESKKKDNNKTNVGKYVGGGIGLGILNESISSKGGFENFAKGYHDAFAKNVEGLIKKNTGKHHEIKELTPEFESMANGKMIASVAATMLCCLAPGTLFDYIANSGSSEEKRH